MLNHFCINKHLLNLAFILQFTKVTIKLGSHGQHCFKYLYVAQYLQQVPNKYLSLSSHPQQPRASQILPNFQLDFCNNPITKFCQSHFFMFQNRYILPKHFFVQLSSMILTMKLQLSPHLEHKTFHNHIPAQLPSHFGEVDLQKARSWFCD